MNGARPGTLSLRADAVYCLAAALGVVFVAPTLATNLAVPRSVFLAVGGGVAVWALALWIFSTRGLRRTLLVVLVANVVAASGAALAGRNLLEGASSLLLFAVALEVLAFAVVQCVALRRLPARPSAV